MRIDLDLRCDPAKKIQDALGDLDRRFGLGDLTPKKYARAKQDLLAQLGRSTIGPFLEPGESITAEHHWTEGQRMLPDSPFRETAQSAASLYATQRRIFRWRFPIHCTPRAASPEDPEEVLEFRWYGEVARIERVRSVRWGEAAAGGVIALAAALMLQHLAITGYVLMGIGAFGVAHALLVPTRWADLVAAGPGGDPWPICASATRSGCAILRELEGRISSERG
jgi:hypothetical protein